MKMARLSARRFLLAMTMLALLPSGGALGQSDRPNILVIWGDDIGWQNVSTYGMCTMGYTTPNIDRIGMEGIRFTDHFAHPPAPPAVPPSLPASTRSDPA